MRILQNLIIALPVIFVALPSCTDTHASELKLKNPYSTAEYNDAFKAYWFAGEAELTSYQLEQARYGEIHQGNAVTIFVTEPFSKNKQVKLDEANEAGADKVDVLKLNFTKTFNTGIYPYSLITSIFSPLETTDQISKSLKISMSAQEWCGHAFVQMNLKGEKYNVQQNSYFESEGDRTFTLDNKLCEDQLWTMIRTTPHLLPTGKINLIPSIQYSRLMHEDIKPYEATASLRVESGMVYYTLVYPHNQRKLEIRFTEETPYYIEGWEETYKDGWGESAKVLTTKATLLKRLKSAYWEHHNNSDAHMRTELGL
jgi:hypothetical protein